LCHTEPLTHANQRIDFIYFDAGGGHRSAANALNSVIEQQRRPWTVRLINLQEILDPLDIFRKYTGIRMQDVYNLLLKKGWTLGSPQMTVLMHGLIRLYHSSQVRLLQKFWQDGKPDLLVSLIPNFNRALREGLPDRPMVTILTDLADYPPHFWMERQDQFFICGTEKAVEQAHAMGHPPERVFRTGGMILRPRFYDPVEVDRGAERTRLGLDPELPTGLVLFGGEGSATMLDIARRMDVRAQLIFICGKNAKLADRLRKLTTAYPKHVEGFTSDIPYYMRLSDFFIGKPGPGSISEALAMGLPVMVEQNAWTLPQERFNADWVRDERLGVVLQSFRDVNDGLKTLLDPLNFSGFQKNATALQNRAVFEIPGILDRLLNTV
jgi:hypothetical protein